MRRSIEKEFQSDQVVYSVFGEFAEIVESEVTEAEVGSPQMEYLYDLRLIITLPGSMISPLEINEGENTVIFEPNGREVQTFEAKSVSESDREKNRNQGFFLLLVAIVTTVIIRKKK